MQNVTSSRLTIALKRMRQVPGSVGAALVDVASGTCLAQIGGQNIDIDCQIDYYSTFMRAKMRTMNGLKMDDAIEEVIFTSRLHYHLIYPLQVEILKSRKVESLFFFVALTKCDVTLMQARLAIKEVITTFLQ